MQSLPKRIPNEHNKIGAIIVAAGSSQRMDGMDKIFSPLLGRPLISYSLEAFISSPDITDIVLVLSRQNAKKGEALIKTKGWSNTITIRVGGDRRQDSVRLGLEGLLNTDWTTVHDGARPCVNTHTISQGLSEARKTGAAVAALPVSNTIKTVDTNMFVKKTLPRNQLWTIQTPQVFRTEILYQAHCRIGREVTDDAEMVEQAGYPVSVFLGSHENIKVTTSADLLIAETLLRARKNQNH